MKLVAFAQEVAEIEKYGQLGVGEIILSDQVLSRHSGLASAQVIHLAQEAQQRQMSVFLQWDVLFTQEQSLDLANYWRQHYAQAGELFTAIRVQDMGALGMLQELNPALGVHLLLEAGHRNLVALQRLAAYCGDRLQRLVLSPEIPHSQLAIYGQAFPGKLEILLMGPILLFYSPRQLLSPLASSIGPHVVMANSEESPHKGFRVIENTHGTLMFHTKDLFLLDVLAQLQNLPLGAYRLDFRHLDVGLQSQLLSLIAELGRQWRPELVSAAKELYPGEITRGFFPVNKTDVLFGKLKNTTLRDSKCLGEVLQVAKDQHLAVKIVNGELALGQAVEIITPEGKRRQHRIEWQKNLRLQEVERSGPEQVVLLNYCKGVSQGALIFLARNHHNHR